MTLNVRPALSEPERSEPAAAAVTASDPERGPEHRALVDEVMTEIASWTLRARIRAFKRWHAGAFSVIHLNVLSLLESEPALSMTRLADTLDVSVASTTGIVDRMEKRGLVARLHDVEDRRVVLVQSTELGRTVCSELDSDARDRIGGLIGELSDEELAGFLLGIRGLRAAHARLFGATGDDQRPEAAEAPQPQQPPLATGATLHVTAKRGSKLVSVTVRGAVS